MLVIVKTSSDSCLYELKIKYKMKVLFFDRIVDHENNKIYLAFR